jgi:tetratricopeptide (TPR) repeat protein
LIDSIAVEVAKLEMDMGDLEAAEMNARQALKLNPAEAHLILSGVALERRDLATAEAEARQALGREERPRIPALIMLARILVEQGRLPEALATIDRAALRITEDKAPPVVTLASTRGDILARLGKNLEAEAAFREEIARFPGTKHAYARLAILLATQHRFAEITPVGRRERGGGPVLPAEGRTARCRAPPYRQERMKRRENRVQTDIAREGSPRSREMRKIPVLLAMAVLIAGAAFAGPVKHAEWAEGPVKHMMTGPEMEKWKTLSTDADAEAFIALFWARRAGERSARGIREARRARQPVLHHQAHPGRHDR